MDDEFVDAVRHLVRSIPPGRVAGYGDVAAAIGRGGARHVGTVMSRYGSDLPWWRVIRSDGRPPQGHEAEAVEHWRSESTPMSGFGEGARARMSLARWRFEPDNSTPRQGERGHLHHVEIWVADLARASREWGWLLARLGYTRGDRWDEGELWQLGPTYLVLERGSDVLAGAHERCRPGVNHLAFHGGDPAEVDSLVDGALQHGWRLMFADRHPFAGGPQHYAAFLENSDGHEVEIVAATPPAR